MPDPSVLCKGKPARGWFRGARSQKNVGGCFDKGWQASAKQDCWTVMGGGARGIRHQRGSRCAPCRRAPCSLTDKKIEGEHAC